MSMKMNTRRAKLEFQQKFLKRAGQNFVHVKRMMDALPNVGFYIKDINDRIITLNNRNCEISALKDEFDAIGKKSSDLFPARIGQECLARDALVRKTGKPVVGGINYATVDRSPNPTIYSVFPLHDSAGNLIGTMCGFYYTEKADNSHLARTKLQPVLEWMTQHEGETTSLETLARLANLSVTHFRRLFMETFNETPGKYALRLRLNRAREMLETSDYTVAAIALEAGFYDQSHFVKAFQRIYRMTPTQYRKRHGAVRAESGRFRGGSGRRNAGTRRIPNPTRGG